MANDKFRVKKTSVPLLGKEVEAKVEMFGDAANTTNKLDPNAPPTKSFTVPMNEYEIELLRAQAEREDRSMRKVARKLLVDALKGDA